MNFKNTAASAALIISGLKESLNNFHDRGTLGSLIRGVLGWTS